MRLVPLADVIPFISSFMFALKGSYIINDRLEYIYIYIFLRFPHLLIPDIQQGWIHPRHTFGCYYTFDSSIRILLSNANTSFTTVRITAVCLFSEPKVQIVVDSFTFRS